MNDYVENFSKAIDKLTDPYEKQFEKNEATDYDFTNFSFKGEIEVETKNTWGKYFVTIENGEILKEKITDDVVINVLEFMFLTRSGLSHKHYIDPDGLDLSICKAMIFNFKDDVLYQIKVKAWEQIETE